MTVLLASAVAAVALAVLARNHADLADSSRVELPRDKRSGPTPLKRAWERSTLNQFTLVVVGVVVVLLSAAVMLPRWDSCPFAARSEHTSLLTNVPHQDLVRVV